MASPLREVELATSGTVDRDDRCASCGEGMYYRVDPAGSPVAMLCGNLMECPEALIERPLPPEKARAAEEGDR